MSEIGNYKGPARQVERSEKYRTMLLTVLSGKRVIKRSVAMLRFPRSGSGAGSGSMSSHFESGADSCPLRQWAPVRVRLHSAVARRYERLRRGSGTLGMMYQ